MYRLLDQLDAELREVFILAELSDVSAPQIAEALSISVNTVYSRIRLARQQLVKLLARARAQQERCDHD